jgi:hypothetical protein
VNSTFSTELTPAQQRLLESLPIPLAAVMMQQIAPAAYFPRKSENWTVHFNP